MNNHTFERKADKLAVVGSHKETRDNAPWDDPTWDIWVFNEAAMMPWAKRVTAVFDIHQEKNYTGTNGIGNADSWGWKQQDHGIDIWMQDVDERVPNSVRYPLAEMREKFPAADPVNTGKGFFTSTPSYALALGLYLGYKTIHTWGIDLGSNTEYLYQANCWRYWCGVAFGMLGSNFKIVEGGHALFKAKLYGYDDDTRSGPDFYREQLEKHNANWARLKKRQAKLRDELTDILGGKGDPKDFGKLFPEAQQAAMDYGEIEARIAEAERYAERAEVLHRQEFEWHAAKTREEVGKVQSRMYTEIGKFEYTFNAWLQAGNVANKAMARNQTAAFLENALRLAYELGKLNGKYRENLFYLNEFDQKLASSGNGEQTDELLAVSNSEAPQ